MVLEVIGAGLLIAFGFLAIYFSSDSSIKDSRYLIYILLGIACIVAGGWVLLTKIGLALMLVKLSGLILALLGFFLVVKFPDVTEYQPADMSKTAIFMGIIMLIVGIYLLFFY